MRRKNKETSGGGEEEFLFAFFVCFLTFSDEERKERGEKEKITKI